MDDLQAYEAFVKGNDGATIEAAVVAQWGESFRRLATNPRLRFDGDAITVVLWVPIKVSGVDTPDLTLREPTMDELQKLDGIRGDMAMAKRMMVTLCTITDREAGQVKMRDLMLISKVVEGFSGAVQGTGGKL